MKTVRRAALNILLKIERNHAFAAPLLAAAMARFQQRDRRLLVDLVYGVQRWRLTLDWAIRQASRRPIEKIDPFTLNLLRLGAYQILFLSKIPPHAAVSTAVALAKSRRGAGGGGFVNAILRQLAENGETLLQQLPGERSAEALSLRVSHPLWLVRRWVDAYGYTEAEALCLANNQPPPATLRVNQHKTTRDTLLTEARRLPAFQEARVIPTKIAGQGLSVTPLSAVFGSDWLEKGLVTIQDEASQLVGEIVAPRPGEWILDACAGIGVKALELLELSEGDTRLICFDPIARKLRQLGAGAVRLGFTPPFTVAARAERPPLAKHPIFDKVLLDAPCSNTGVLRRHPERKWRLEEGDIGRLVEIQWQLLSAAAPLVKRGGAIIYSTCSLEREEGEEMISRFLAHHREFEAENCALFLAPEGEAYVENGMFRSFPHRGGMDGFFCARLRRTA